MDRRHLEASSLISPWSDIGLIRQHELQFICKTMLQHPRCKQHLLCSSSNDCSDLHGRSVRSLPIQRSGSNIQYMCSTCYAQHQSSIQNSTAGPSVRTSRIKRPRSSITVPSFPQWIFIRIGSLASGFPASDDLLNTLSL